MLSKWLLGGCVIVPLAIGVWSSASVNGQGFGGSTGPVERPGSLPRAGIVMGADATMSGASVGGMMGGRTIAVPAEELSLVDELTLEDARLEHEIQQLVAHLAEGNPDAAALAEGRKGVAELLDQQFAVRQQRREKQIIEIEERVTRLREALKKRAEAKPQMVERRLNELFSEVEGLGWGEVGDGRARGPGMRGTGGPTARSKVPVGASGDWPIPSRNSNIRALPGKSR